MSVLLDIQAVQSPAHGERGIARYVLNLASALERRHAGLLSGYLLNPSLPVPGSVEPLLGRGRISFSDRVDPTGVRVQHVASAIESVPLEQLLPSYTRRLRVVVTLYDLIPKLFPEVYLADPATLAWYGMRLELVRSADRVLAISEATKRDAVEQLGVPAERVVTVGAGVSEQFKRPEHPARVLDELRTRFPWLRSGFVLYTGGIEPRKNIDRLLVAYAGLPAGLHEHHQLVIVCRVRPEERAVLDRRLRKLGIAGQVWFPGFVDDAALVRLYQACELFVFPPLYEGFGLPVAEAIACGAPVISSHTSSLPELVGDPEALFDPHEPEAIRAALERALVDDGFRRRLAEVELDDRHTWEGVAARTAAVYQELLSEPPRPRRRMRIAFVSPLPPARSGIAGASHALLEELVGRFDVDAFADQAEAEVPPGVQFEPVQRFESAERARGGYDHVVVCLGNSEHNAEALSLVRRRRSVVIAHDVRLAGLYAWMAAHRQDLEPRGLQGALREMYGGRLPATVGASGGLDVSDYERYGVVMAREAIACAERYLVHSEYAADLARLDAARRDLEKIGVLPFGVTPPARTDDTARTNGSAHVVASFGIVGPAKQPEKLIEAFAVAQAREPEVELVFVGPVEPVEERRLCGLAERLGIAGSVRFTGELGDADFGRAMRDASVAVQLRTVSNGETSAAVMECLALGVPAVVSAIGSARELPDDAVVKVPRDVPPEALAAKIAALLEDADARAALGAAGCRYSEEHSFVRVADELERELERL